jgi:hypothetical protein
MERQDASKPDVAGSTPFFPPLSQARNFIQEFVGVTLFHAGEVWTAAFFAKFFEVLAGAEVQSQAQFTKPETPVLKPSLPAVGWFGPISLHNPHFDLAENAGGLR